MRLSRSDLELEVLVNRIDREELDLQPDYQRGEVWDKARQQRLIDTILRGWYVPAVHIVRDPHIEKEMVLDGQQRLRTIHAFFKDRIAVAGRWDPLSPELSALDGLRYSQLPASDKRRVQRFELTVVTLTDYAPAEPSELFFRLNQQYALTPSEKRNALFGEARDQVKQVVGMLVQSGSFSKDLLGFSNGRLAYDDVIARFCIALQDGHIRRHVSNKVVEDFYRRESFSSDVVTRAHDAAASLGVALRETGGLRLNKATLFSWLVFYSKVAITTSRYPDIYYLRRFEEQRQKRDHLRRPALRVLMSAYSDRASYRVLDVSSVLMRDFVLHMAYALLYELPLPVVHASSLLDRIEDDLLPDPEKEILEFLDYVEWGTVG